MLGCRQNLSILLLCLYNFGLRQILSIKSKFTKLTFCQNFLAGFTGQGLFYQDPTVWLDEAKPANACIAPSFLENTPVQLNVAHTPKICLQAKKLAEFGEITFLFLQIPFGNSQLVKCEI